MPINNSDLNSLLKKAIGAGKPQPWYYRWWNKPIFNLKVCIKLIIMAFIFFSFGNFAYQHPILFMIMVATLG